MFVKLLQFPANIPVLIYVCIYLALMHYSWNKIHPWPTEHGQAWYVKHEYFMILTGLMYKIGIHTTDYNELSQLYMSVLIQQMQKIQKLWNGKLHINGLVQDCSNSIANALELLQSCTKPLIWQLYMLTLWCYYWWYYISDTKCVGIVRYGFNTSAPFY